MGCHESDSHEPKQKDNLSSSQGGAKNLGGITKSSLVFGLILVLIAGVFFGYFFKSLVPSEDHLAMITSKSVEDQREDFVSLANNIKAEMAKQGKYNCCIEKPCTYCIEKTPEHGEGAACECMDDILAGRHPCGECIGEILEGNGEPELKDYFAKAIAHKVGAKHEEHLQEIIDDMYPEAQ